MSIAADQALAEDPTTSDEVLFGRLSHRDWHVRWSAAQNPGAGDAVRLAALATGDKHLASAVGQLGDTLSLEVRDAVCAHPRREGREGLALTANDRTTLDRLVADPDPKVRAAVAQPDHRPADLMRLLARDRRAEVRAAVAASTTIPDDLALELLADRSAVVRWSLLTMRDGDLRFARALVDDPDEMNRAHARFMLFQAGERAEH
ncbi:hypothetical protein [Demequina mangrovi]|nr:hypothetical protein [Demequina mangrovi]